MDKVKYVQHPVTPEAKAKLRAKGYKIIDARFDPNPKPTAKPVRKKDAVFTEDDS